MQADGADLRGPGQGPGGSWSRPPRCRRRRASSRDEVESRKQAMVDQLERIGASLEEYLAAEEQDRGGDRRRAGRGGDRGRQDPAAARHPGRRRGRSRSPTTSSVTRSCTGRSAPGWPRSSTTTSWSAPAPPAPSSATCGGARRSRSRDGADQDQGLGRQRGHPGRAARPRTSRRTTTTTSTDPTGRPPSARRGRPGRPKHVSGYVSSQLR